MAGTALCGRLTWQTAAVTSVTRETSSFCTIGLDLPDWPGHRAGQHVDVRLTAEDGYTAEREYSTACVHSAPAQTLDWRCHSGDAIEPGPAEANASG
jgi:ferredoxin-NADP reductase